MRVSTLPKPPRPWPFFQDPRRACLDVLDANIFFPEDAGVSAARKVCASCPVRDDCREWAIRYELIGVWGGTSAEERDRERRVRAGVAERVCEVCEREFVPRVEWQRACGSTCGRSFANRGRA